SYGSRLRAFDRRCIPCTAIINCVWLDEAQCQKGKYAQCRRSKEDCIVCEMATDKALSNGGESEAGCSEAIISSGPRRHGARAYESEANRRNCYRDDRCGESVEEFGDKNKCSLWRHRKDQCGTHAHHNP